MPPHSAQTGRLASTWARRVAGRRRQADSVSAYSSGYPPGSQTASQGGSGSSASGEKKHSVAPSAVSVSRLAG